MNQQNNDWQVSTGGPLSVDTVSSGSASRGAPSSASVQPRRTYLKEAPARSNGPSQSKAPVSPPKAPGKNRRRRQGGGGDHTPVLGAVDGPAISLPSDAPSSAAGMTPARQRTSTRPASVTRSPSPRRTASMHPATSDAQGAPLRGTYSPQRRTTAPQNAAVHQTAPVRQADPVRRSPALSQAVAARRAAGVESPHQNDLGVAHDYAHYHRGGLSTYPAPMAFADGLAALLSAGLAYASFAALALVLVGKAGLLPLSEPLPNQRLILTLFAVLCLAAALLMVLSALGIGAGDRQGSGGPSRPAPVSAWAAMGCWLVAGGLALFGAIRSGLPVSGPGPSGSGLGIWLTLGCLGLILVTLARVLLSRHACRQSEILSTADPGFARQLSDLARQRNLIFVGVLVVLLLAYAGGAWVLFR